MFLLLNLGFNLSFLYESGYLGILYWIEMSRDILSIRLCLLVFLETSIGYLKKSLVSPVYRFNTVNFVAFNIMAHKYIIWLLISNVPPWLQIKKVSLNIWHI